MHLQCRLNCGAFGLAGTTGWILSATLGMFWHVLADWQGQISVQEWTFDVCSMRVSAFRIRCTCNERCCCYCRARKSRVAYRLGCHRSRRLRPPICRGRIVELRAQPRVWRKDAVEPGEMRTRWRDQRREFGDKFHRLELHVRRAVLQRRLELVALPSLRPLFWRRRHNRDRHQTATIGTGIKLGTLQCLSRSSPAPHEAVALWPGYDQRPGPGGRSPSKRRYLRPQAGPSRGFP